jgi:S1-C subfamily serine protease
MQDFNTFYMQAASGTSGGSSGSPVLNIQGHAVALNAGGSNSSQSSFYLPLHRVVRAVEKIKKGEHVSRGTLQTEFLFKSYDELQRLGMDAKLEEECRARFPNASGLLSVIRVLRGGPASATREDADKYSGTTPEGFTRVPGLEPGDILLSCNGKHLISFVELYEIIDDSVGEEITLEFFRSGKDGGASGMCQVTCRVQDLHSITPSRFLEIGGATFHDLSYQVARSHNIELGTGVFCAASGFLLWSSWSRDFLVTAVDGKPTKTLDQFIEVIRTLPDRKRVPIMTRALGKSDERVMMVDIDRHFFLASIFERDDVAGTWNRMELEPAPVEETQAVVESAASEPEAEEEEEEDPETRALDKIKSALVNVVCRLPYSVYGNTSASNFSGVGVIVAVDPIPLVVFDRTSVPTEMLDIRLTVSNKSFPGRVVHLGAFALVTFDRELLPENITVPTWDEVPLKVRDEVRVVGLTSDQLLVTKDSTICSIGMNFNTKQCNPPRHRQINVENINVLEAPSCWGGIIARKPSGPSDTLKVAALYLAVSSQNRKGDDVCWTQGIDIQRYIMPVVKQIQAGVESGIPQPVEPPTRDLGIEFSDMPLSTVSTMGLSETRFKGFVKAAKKFRGNPRPLVVETRLRPLPLGTDEEANLKIADILLEIEGKPIYRVSELTDLRLEDKETVEVIVLRGRKEVKLTIPTVKSWPSSSTTIVQFFGSILHATHGAALEQVASTATLVPQKVPGVYVGGVSYGSPALNNIRPTHWILEIDGTPVNSIEDVLALVKEKRWKQGEYVRVKQVSRKDITSLVSVKVDERFWPTLCWTKDTENAKGFGWKQERWSGEEFVQPFKA